MSTLNPAPPAAHQAASQSSLEPFLSDYPREAAGPKGRCPTLGMRESPVGPMNPSPLASIPRDGPGSRLPSLSTVSGCTKAQRFQQGGHRGPGPSVSRPQTLETDFDWVEGGDRDPVTGMEFTAAHPRDRGSELRLNRSKGDTESALSGGQSL